MPRAGVEYEAVLTAVQDLEREGVRPTVRAVRERVGGGSNSTIARHLMSALGTRPPAKTPELAPRVAGLLAAEIERAFAEGRAAGEEGLLLARENLAELADALKKTEDQREAQRDAAVNARAARDEALADLRAARAVLKEREAEIARLRDDCASHVKQLRAQEREIERAVQRAQAFESEAREARRQAEAAARMLEVERAARERVEIDLRELDPERFPAPGTETEEQLRLNRETEKSDQATAEARIRVRAGTGNARDALIADSPSRTASSPVSARDQLVRKLKRGG